MFGIDYDGVIADTNTLKTQWVKKHIKRDIPPYECDRTSLVPLIGEHHYDMMSREIYGREPSLTVRPVPGVRKALETLREHGPVYIITARTNNQLSFAQEWLERNNLAPHICEAISVTNKPKLTVAKRYGCKVMIDDDVRHLIAMPSPTILLILLKIGQRFVKEVENRVTVCTTWRHAALQAIRQVQER